MPTPTSSSQGPRNPSAVSNSPSASSISRQVVLPLVLRQPGEHLVQRAERLPLELGALRRGGELERRLDPVHLDVAESGRVELVAERSPTRTAPGAQAPAAAAAPAGG